MGSAVRRVPPAARDSLSRGAAGVSAVVDARGLGSSGIGRYLREILTGLFQDQRFTAIRLLGNPEILDAFCAHHSATRDRVAVVAYPGSFYSPASQLAWVKLRAAGVIEADVAFFPHYDVPLFGLPTRSVVTVHDFTHFTVPEAFAAWKRGAASLLLHKSVSGAARVLTGSQAARSDIVERFPSAAAKIQVVPHGVSDVFREHVDPAAAKQRLGIQHPYLLCVGNGKPHKNLVAAVEALALLRQDHPDITLLVVGQAYEGAGELRRVAAGLGVNDAVIELQSVDDEALRALYAGCEVFLFPSLYEGFGLPLLEAMACGAPVVASDQASIPEVAGGAALLIGPTDYAGMAALSRRLLDDHSFREDLIRRGYQRAAEFTWESAARQTREVLLEVAGLGAAT